MRTLTIYIYSLMIVFFGGNCYAVENTMRGKIISVEGHVTPNCRRVVHKSNVAGPGGENEIRVFRIQDVSGDDSVASVVMAAFLSNKDVHIYFEPAVTTGCGSEPKIRYITIMK